MKKRLSVLLVAMMTLVMAAPALAAPSPAAKGVVNVITSAKDKNGNDTDVVIRDTEVLFKELDEEKRAVYEEAVKNVTEKATAKKTVEDAIISTVKPEEMEDFLKGFNTEYSDVADLASKVEVVDVKDVHVEDPSSVEWPLTISFEVPGVVEDSTVIVLHFEGESWEMVPSQVIADGEVEASFDSLSPVAFVVDKATLADAKDEVIEEEKEDVKEDKAPVEKPAEEPEESSSNTMIYVIIVIALIAVVAVIIAKKKNK